MKIFIKQIEIYKRTVSILIEKSMLITRSLETIIIKRMKKLLTLSLIEIVGKKNKNCRLWFILILIEHLSKELQTVVRPI